MCFIREKKIKKIREEERAGRILKDRIEKLMCERVRKER